MGLLSFILGITESVEKSEKQKKQDELEKEMDNYALDEEEKEIVREGIYDPSSFEYPGGDEELDEDDYYHEYD